MPLEIDLNISPSYCNEEHVKEELLNSNGERNVEEELLNSIVYIKILESSRKYGKKRDN